MTGIDMRRRDTLKIVGYSTWHSKIGDPMTGHYLLWFKDFADPSLYIIKEIPNTYTLIIVNRFSLSGRWLRLRLWLRFLFERS